MLTYFLINLSLILLLLSHLYANPFGVSFLDLFFFHHLLMNSLLRNHSSETVFYLAAQEKINEGAVG